MRHLDWNKITLPGADISPSATSASFGDAAWQIVGPAGNNPNTKRKFSPLSITFSEFKVEALKKHAKKVKNPHQAEVLMLFISCVSLLPSFYYLSYNFLLLSSPCGRQLATFNLRPGSLSTFLLALASCGLHCACQGEQYADLSPRCLP